VRGARADVPEERPPAHDPLLRSVTAADRIVFRSPLVAIASHRCPPDHPLFSAAGPSGNAVFAFPRCAVWMQPEGQERVLEQSTLVSFLNGQGYRRTRFGDDGDVSDWYWVEPATLRDVVRRQDPAAADSDRPFRFAWGPCDPRTYLEQRRAFVHAATAAAPDRLYLEETTLWILDRALAAAYRLRGVLARDSGATARRRSDLAEAAKALLMGRPSGARLDLHGLALELGCSAFHLSHVFRRQTGFKLSEYLHQIRLRESLEGVADPSVQLAALARELGYASPSHFTLFFRRAFQVTPSSLRGRLFGLPFRLGDAGASPSQGAGARAQ